MGESILIPSKCLPLARLDFDRHRHGCLYVEIDFQLSVRVSVNEPLRCCPLCGTAHLEESVGALLLGLHVSLAHPAHQLLEPVTVRLVAQERLRQLDELRHVQRVLIERRRLRLTARPPRTHHYNTTRRSTLHVLSLVTCAISGNMWYAQQRSNMRDPW